MEELAITEEVLIARVKAKSDRGNERRSEES